MVAEEHGIGLIVDAYATGSFLPAAFNRHGCDVVHVQSTPRLRPRLVPPQLDSYIANIVHAGDYARTLAAARSFSPRFVVAGQEPGVPFADRLSEDLGLASNGSAGSTARRNKWEMIDTVSAAGLRCARQHLSASPADAIEWTTKNRYSTCVVKPLSSAATDLVRICRDSATLTEAVADILSHQDVFGTQNRHALVQSFLEGDEFIVDTVSMEGHHFVCGVWKYKKVTLPNGCPIYDRDILMPHDQCTSLIDYTTSVLDALGIANGPAHSEVMLTPDGPALVELGARLNGDMHPAFHDVCLGGNQADLTALAYTDPKSFIDACGGKVYQRQQHATVYNAATALQGSVRKINHSAVRAIEERPSVYELEVKLAPGEIFRPTRDLMTSPLRVFLTSFDPEMIESDYHYIRSAKDDVYILT